MTTTISISRNDANRMKKQQQVLKYRMAEWRPSGIILTQAIQKKTWYSITSQLVIFFLFWKGDKFCV